VPLAFGVTERLLRLETQTALSSNRLLKVEIKLVFDDEKRCPGAPRIARRLQDEGNTAGRHCVASVMRDNGWRAKAARKYKAITNSKHSLPVAPNSLTSKPPV
jgi:putative transposase